MRAPWKTVCLNLHLETQRLYTSRNVSQRSKHLEAPCQPRSTFLQGRNTRTIQQSVCALFRRSVHHSSDGQGLESTLLFGVLASLLYEILKAPHAQQTNQPSFNFAKGSYAEPFNCALVNLAWHNVLFLNIAILEFYGHLGVL